MTARRQPATVDGQPGTASVTDAGLQLDRAGAHSRLVSWLDIDDVDEGDHRVALHLADSTSTVLTKLGATHDVFMAELRAARRALRLPALTAATGAPEVTFLSRDPGGLIDVHIFARAVVVEPRRGAPTVVPLALIEEVRLDGHTVHIVCRAVDDIRVGMLGQRTTEFVDRLGRARTALRAATARAFEQHDPMLVGVDVPDGWAVRRAESPITWDAMHRTASAGERAAEVAVLAELAGDRLAYGLHTDGGAHPLPFLLAPVRGVVVVEAVAADDRATFVFRTDDVERLNAALLLTGFRREVLSLPVGELGRWAVAVRTSPVVQWARAAVAGRVVHGDTWERDLRALVP